MPYIVVKSQAIDNFIKDNPDQASIIDAIIQDISNDPFADGKTKFYYYRSPVMYYIYHGRGLKCLYIWEKVNQLVRYKLVCILK